MSQNRLKGGTAALARAICCAGVLSACATGSNDGDVTDSGSVDSGTTPIDAAITPDGGQVGPDASMVDAATPDAALLDAALLDAALPDAALPDAGLPDAGCIVSALELLNNGNFDMGAGIWLESSGGAFPIVVEDSTVTGLTADTPTVVGWLGGYSAVTGTVTDTLLQDVVVPMDATPLAFSGKFRIATEEISSIAYDQLKLEILDPATSAILEEITVWSNDDANAAWETFTGSATGNYAGQTIRVRFIATMDFSNNTAFFIDSWSATTTSCQ